MRLIAYLAGLNAPSRPLSFIRPPARRIARALWWAREIWRALP